MMTIHKKKLLLHIELFNRLLRLDGRLQRAILVFLSFTKKTSTSKRLDCYLEDEGVVQDVQVGALGGGAQVSPGRGAPDAVTDIVLRHGEPCKQVTQ